MGLLGWEYPYAKLDHDVIGLSTSSREHFNIPLRGPGRGIADQTAWLIYQPLDLVPI